MEKELLKFNIQERLNKLPHDVAKDIIPKLPEMLGISRVQLHRIKTTPKDSDYEPRADILIKIAGLFECNPEDLYTEPVSKLLPAEKADADSVGLSK